MHKANASPALECEVAYLFSTERFFAWVRGDVHGWIVVEAGDPVFMENSRLL